MATKKICIEELERECIEAENTFKKLKEQLIQAKKEEEEAERVKLQAEKEARKKEVDDAITNAKHLIRKYIDDYGIYSFTSSNDDEIFNSRFWNWVS